MILSSIPGVEQVLIQSVSRFDPTIPISNPAQKCDNLRTVITSARLETVKRAENVEDVHWNLDNSDLLNRLI